MGGSTKQTQTTKQVSSKTPYAPAKTGMDSLLSRLAGTDPSLTGTETGALDALQTNAAAGNPYAPAIGDVATDLLSGGIDRTGMVNDAYNAYKNYLSPIVGGGTDPTQNAQLMQYMQTAGDDASKRVNDMFAAAGRDFSGAHAQAYGRGVTAAQAPIMYDAYNRMVGRSDTAANNLYGAGTGSAGMLSGLDQIALGNRQAGIGASTAAMQAQDSPYERMLQIEAQRYGIPTSRTSGLLAPVAAVADAFGTSRMNGTTTTETKQPLTNQIAGGLIGGAGLLGQMGAFGPAGWLYGTGANASGLINGWMR